MRWWGEDAAAGSGELLGGEDCPAPAVVIETRAQNPNTVTDLKLIMDDSPRLIAYLVHATSKARVSSGPLQMEVGNTTYVSHSKSPPQRVVDCVYR